MPEDIVAMTEYYLYWDISPIGWGKIEQERDQFGGGCLGIGGALFG